jgi:hypothetical protein
VYALGCVLYQALTGAVPYPRDTDTAKMWAHINAPVPSVTESAPELPHQLDEVVRRAMAKEPQDRYPSACDLGRAALAAVGETTERTVATGSAASDAAPTIPQGTAAAPQVTDSQVATLPAERRPWLSRARAHRGSLAAVGTAVVALVAAVAVLSNSGGATKRGAATTHASVARPGNSSGLSKSQLDAKVNAACKVYKTATSSASVPSDFLINANAAAAFLDKIDPPTQTEYLAVSELRPAASLKANFDAYLANGTYRLGLLNDERGKAHANDLRGLRRDYQALATNLQTVTLPLKRKLGFTACF